MAIILKNATYIHWETLEFIDTHIIVQEDGENAPEFIKNLDGQYSFLRF